MTRIRVLDDHLINKIAAGEVVARPASVVKELLENSLDAGATRIDVEMEDGGLTLLRISDDGEGMSEEDALLALKRHATSKLSCEDDLADIRTLGFRGEALPSIASVSRLEIRTRRAEAEGGTRLAIEGGTLGEVRPAAATVGTLITVRDLFFNTPARRKFLRAEATEARHIIETVAQAILSHPAVSFKLSIPGKAPLLSSPGTGKLFDALVAVLGPATARGMLPMGPREHPELRYRVHGYISRPDIHRATRNGLHLFVNGRPVQIAQFARVLTDAYQAYLPRGRFPVAVVFVHAEPWAVDVNVHPQKLEVRLHQPERLAGLLGAAARDALAGERRPETVVPDAAETSAAFARPIQAGPGGWRPSRPILPYLPVTGLPGSPPEGPSEATAAPPGPPGSTFGGACGAASPGAAGASLFARGVPADGAEWEHMRVLGQAFRTFVVGTTDDRLYFLDQHTAHERVLYERHVAMRRSRKLETQQLLFPVTVDCPRRSPEELEDVSNLLSSCGFDCSVFSGGSLVVKGIPVLDRGIDVQTVMTELVEEAAGAGPLEDRLDRVAKTMSCRAAVKAGDTLSPPEMEALIRDLARTENPLRCPHGRQVLLQFGLEELKRLFDRNW